MAALTTQAGLGPEVSATSGADLEAMDETQRANAVAILLSIQPIRSFFGLVPLERTSYLAITGTVAAWVLILRFTWRARLLDRFLGVDL